MVNFYLPVYLLSSFSLVANAFVAPTSRPGASFVVSKQGSSSMVSSNKASSSFPFPTTTSLSMSSSSAVTPELSDEVLTALLKDLAIENDITDVDLDAALELVKDSLEAKEDAFTVNASAVRTESYEAAYVMSTSSVNACEWSIVEFSVEAVSLAMAAAGMPSGTSKRVAKILVKKAKKKLMKEMKGIVKDYFGSPNPFNIAKGLFKIMDIIIGDIGFKELSSIIYNSVSWWDAVKIVGLLSLYFVSGGSGLAAKLGIMTPAIIDCIEAGYEVSQVC